MLKRLLLATAIGVALSVVLVFWVLPGYLPDSTDEPVRDFSAVGGDFSLETLDGPLERADFEGQVVMLFFGFTHCPDYCLASLATQRQVLSALEEHEQGQVRGLFVSVDPERDDLATLAEYTDFFHPDIIGATGSKSAIDAMTEQFYATYYFVDTPDSELDYLVEHTTRTYLLGKDGQVVDLFTHDEPYTRILSRIREVL